MPTAGVLRCFVAAALFGISVPAASALAGEMPALVLAGLLYLGAGLAVAPAVVRRPPTRTAVVGGFAPLAGAVVAGGVVGPALLVVGLARTEAATASILLNLELAATVVLAATVFREQIGRRVVAGAALVTVAGVLLVGAPGERWDAGAALVVAACVAWGLDNCLTARIDQLSPETVVLAKGLVAGSFNLALGALTADEVALAGGSVVAALAVGAVGYGVSIVLWVRGARDLGAARAQVVFATAPFLAAATSWIALGEPVEPVQLVAAALAAAGVAVSLDSAHEHLHEHERVVHEHAHGDDHHDDDHHDAGGRHRHDPVVHSHPHVPDLHHRHRHRPRR